ncbi:MAG: hypothetical protein SGCHY_005309 [Lobulomycetales sp.]
MRQIANSQQLLHAAAENMFPAYRKLASVQSAVGRAGKKQQQQQNLFPDIPVEVSSDVPLQILMSCTFWLYPVWVVSTLNNLILKITVYGLVDFHRFMVITLWPLFLVCEPLRLRLGYTGNLQESIPDLAGFVLLSAFPQLPITVYYIAFQPISILGFSLPLDIALNVVYAVLLVAQIAAALLGGRKIVEAHAAQFLLRQSFLKSD